MQVDNDHFRLEALFRPRMDAPWFGYIAPAFMIAFSFLVSLGFAEGNYGSANVWPSTALIIICIAQGVFRTVIGWILFLAPCVALTLWSTVAAVTSPANQTPSGYLPFVLAGLVSSVLLIVGHPFRLERTERDRAIVWTTVGLLILIAVAPIPYVLSQMQRYSAMRSGTARVTSKRSFRVTHNYDYRQPSGQTSNVSYDEDHWFVTYKIEDFLGIDEPTRRSLLNSESKNREEEFYSQEVYDHLAEGQTLSIKWKLGCQGSYVFCRPMVRSISTNLNSALE